MGGATHAGTSRFGIVSLIALRSHDGLGEQIPLAADVCKRRYRLVEELAASQKINFLSGRLKLPCLEAGGRS